MTARQKLTEIVQTRKWYGSTFNPSTAASIKARVLNRNPNEGEQITDDRIVEILKQLGYKPKQKESW